MFWGLTYKGALATLVIVVCIHSWNRAAGHCTLTEVGQLTAFSQGESSARVLKPSLFTAWVWLEFVPRRIFIIMAKLSPNSRYGQKTQAAKYPSGFCETRVSRNLSVFVQSGWSEATTNCSDCDEHFHRRSVFLSIHRL
jgi:hypothetical protein